MHVLVWNDDASTRFVVRRLLAQNLACTIECADGVTVLNKLDEEEADLLVLDIEISGLDGVEVLEAIQTSSATRPARDWGSLATGASLPPEQVQAFVASPTTMTVHRHDAAERDERFRAAPASWHGRERCFIGHESCPSFRRHGCPRHTVSQI